jgi:hypothetical protein
VLRPQHADTMDTSSAGADTTTAGSDAPGDQAIPSEEAYRADDSLGVRSTASDSLGEDESGATVAEPDTVLSEVSLGQPIDLQIGLVDGLPMDSLPPARRPLFELQDQLRDSPGGFLYDLGSYGWPHGWSPHGIDPQEIGLVWNGLSMNDMFTGRALYEFIPISLSGPLALAPIRHGRAVSVASTTLPLDARDPLTEIRFQTDNRGLQKISGFHVQNRPLTLFGTRGIVNVVALYRGEGATGDYADSQLRRGRQLYGRFRYRQPRWVFEIAHLYNRQRVGAHGGVVPPDPNDPNSVYFRKIADVENSDSERKAIRNDLSAVLGLDWLNRSPDPLTVRLHWGGERFEYRRPGDTLGVSVRRFGVHATQPFTLGRHQIEISADGWTDRVETEFAGLSDTIANQERLFVLSTARLRFGSLHLTGTAGLDALDNDVDLQAHARAALDLGALGAFVDLRQTRQSRPMLMNVGLGRFLPALGDAMSGTLRHAEIGLSLKWRSVDVTATMFAERSSNWTDLFETADSDSAVFMRTAEAVVRTAASIDFGIRRAAEKGIYVLLRPSWTHLLDDGGTATGALLEETVPRFHGSAQLGMRYVIFTGDFDFDLAVRARAWEPMRSRRLHTASGLLAVPASRESGVDGSVTLDLILVAGVRAASLFLAWENLLAGTTYIPGNMLVPVYPLSQKRLRFGIHWPIRN